MSSKSTAYNKCISDFADAPSKFLAPLGTSDMPQTLSAMLPVPKVKEAVANLHQNVEKGGIR